MTKYVYPAVFTPEENGQYSVDFPDVPNCFTCGDSLADAIIMAQDVLSLVLVDIEDGGGEIPVASSVFDVQKTANDADTVSLVACDTLEYRKLYDGRAVKKNLSIPNWLNTMAEREGVNFSAILQAALKKHLDID